MSTCETCDEYVPLVNEYGVCPKCHQWEREQGWHAEEMQEEKTMADLYTSYSTSLALRDAGAEQEPHPHKDAGQIRLAHSVATGAVTISGCVPSFSGVTDGAYWADTPARPGWALRNDTVEIDRCTNPEWFVRAFRADEIIETLHAATGLVEIGSCDDEWDVACGRACCAATEPTLVEALARTWLAVLKEPK